MTNISQYLEEGYKLQELGYFSEAVDFYWMHLEEEPKHAETLERLGALYSLMGKHKESEKCYSRLLLLMPMDAGVHFSLGNSLQAQDKTQQAKGCYRAALRINPSHSLSMVNLAYLLMQSGQPTEAKNILERAVKNAPENAEAHNNLGALLVSLGDPTSAYKHLIKALELKPNDIGATTNLAMVYQEFGNPKKALELYGQALDKAPDNILIRCARATALRDLDQTVEALRDLDDVIANDPGYAEAHSNRAAVLQDMGKITEALNSHQKAVSLAPKNPQIRWNRAQTLLLSGDFENGWKEFEWRLKCRQGLRSLHTAPVWNGSALSHKTILLTLERGLGDTIQFCRFANTLKKLGAIVALECQPELVRLLYSNKNIDIFVRPGDTSFACDFQLPLVSLPGMLRINPLSSLDTPPYLTPSKSSLRRMASVINSPGQFKVGLCWAGSQQHTNDKRRSHKPNITSIFSDIPNVTLFSLQKKMNIEDREWLDGQDQIRDLSSFCHDFEDTAAAIASLDLVISVDTSVAHLAGALSCPVWTLLPFAPDWRWGLKKNSSAWYPSMSLFRQAEPNDWIGLFKHVHQTLRNHIT